MSLRVLITALTPKSTIAAKNEALLATAKIRPEKRPEIDLVAARVLEGRDRYEVVASALGNGIPWWFIGITHFMEAGAFYPKHFTKHLHCGDPLTGRTFNIPKGRPLANPGGGDAPPSSSNPYTWQESALDALKLMKYDKVTNWSVGNCLWLFEKFNGLGYRNYHNMLSPYVWSYTTLYSKGKYASDGKFDPELVSRQPGTAAIYLGLVEKGVSLTL